MRMEEVWLIGCLAVAVPLLVVCAIGWWQASRRAHWLESQMLNPPGQQESTQRLEQVVEGLSSQINELANGQDFLQRMLTTRRIPSTAEAPKVSTPA